MEQLIKYFLDETIPNEIMTSFNMPFIKFVFPDDALDLMEKYNKETTKLLRKNKHNYEIGRKKKEDVFIVVDDYQQFFSLLNEIVLTYGQREYKGFINSRELMGSIWLRMSPSDVNDVNDFLKRQLSFLKNDNILPYYQKRFSDYEDLEIIYQNESNERLFETNNNITFSFVRDVDSDLDGIPFPIRYYYDLPAIHYALRREDDTNVCYIYGIQNLDSRKDEIIKQKIKSLRKKYQNKYVSPDFVISLKLFIDLLSKKKLYTIKVPLLQLFNYPFHQRLSDDIKNSYSAYENKDELEKMHESGNDTDMVLDYLHDKETMGRFADKEDTISYNKTERFVNTFLVLSEMFDNIEFLNEPFIEGDYLIIKIKQNSKTL